MVYVSQTLKQILIVQVLIKNKHHIILYVLIINILYYIINFIKIYNCASARTL